MKQISKSESDLEGSGDYDRNSGNTVSISTIDMVLYNGDSGISYVAHYVMNYLGLSCTELSLCIVNDSTIQSLNKSYRDIDEPTDVLSFSQKEGDGVPCNALLGDVVCAPAYIQRQAAGRNIPYVEEFTRCIIHGILHLYGMDHAEENSEMLLLQEKILKDLQEDNYFDSTIKTAI